MKRILQLLALVCLYACIASAQTTVTGTFLPQSGLTPQAAGLTVLQQVNGTNVCGQLDFVAYNASVTKPWSILWNGQTHLPQNVRGYVRCSDGALISATGAVGLPLIPNTDAQPQGTLTWMSGGLTGSTDGTLRPVSWSEAKAIPDQTTVDWGTLPVAQIVNVGYQTVESQAVALNARPTLNFTGGMSCVDNLASNRTDCQPTSLTNPMTGVGDLLYGGTSGAPQRLGGNTTTTREFLISQGTGSAAQAPFLGALQASDIPSTIASNTSGNAATATEFFTVPTQCTSGQYSTGITIFGNANCATVNFSQLGGTATEGQLPNTVVFTDQNAQFGAHNYDFGLATEFVIPKSSDPGSPVTGQHWLNGAALKYRDNAGTPATHTIEVQDNKNVANGYAGLNGSGVVPPAEIPAPTSSTLGGVESFATVTHQFLNALSGSGVFGAAQPQFTDIGGTASPAQIPLPSATTIGGVESLTCSNQFLLGISTLGVPSCGTVTFSEISGFPALPANTPAVAGEFITAYNSTTGAFTQAGLPTPSSGTLGGVESLSVVAHNFMTGISTSGVPSQAQPAFTDISGVASAAQLPTPTASTLGGIESFAVVSHEWINSISTAGVPSASQPTFGDISGTLGAAQLPSPTATTLGGTESAACSNQFLTGINTAGVPQCGTVSYSQVSGAPTAPGNTPAVTNEAITAYNSSTGVFTQAQLAYSGLTGLPTLEYQTVENSGSALTQRAVLNFTGSGVSCADNSGLGRTDCTITGGGGGGGYYQTVDANGTSQVQQPIINFISGTNASVNCTNNGGATRTDCTFSASSSAGGRLDQISSAGATNTQNNTTYAQVWGWALTGSQTGMTFGEASAATGSGNIILRATTASGSTAVPFQADSNGNGVQVTTAGKLTTVGTGSIDATKLNGLVPVASIPNPTSSTIGGIESYAAVSHQWINTISTSGVPSSTQPAFTDISGSVASSQLPNPGASTLGGVESITCSNQFLTGISTSGVPVCGTVAYSEVSGTPTLPANTPAVTGQVLTAYNSTTGAFTQAALPNPTSSTLGGIESLAFTSHFFISSISTSGVPSATQPAFTDISGSVAASQLPNPSATTLGGIESFASVSHEWISAISTSGVPSATQPAFTDISGTATVGQLPSSVVENNTTNTYTSGSFNDFSLSSMLKVPVSGGLSPTASGIIGYDSTANLYVAGANGTKHNLAFIDSNITGNAATATAFASTPTLCSTGFAPTGITATGNATGCAAIPSLTAGGDASGTLPSLTVVGLEGISLPTLASSTGFLYDNAGALQLTTSASNLTTGTLPHAQLPTLLSGDIPNNAANTTGTAAALAATPTNCGAGNAATGILANGNATGCFTPTGLSGLTTDGLIYATSSTNATSVTPPTGDGVYNCGYTVTGGVVVTPTCPLSGVGGVPLNGSTTSLPITYAMNLQIITHDHAATGTGAVSLPTPTTLGNSNFVTSYCNYSPQTDVVTPAGSWTINQSSTLNVPQGACYRIRVDPTNSNAWLADGSGSIGGSVTNPNGNFTTGYSISAANNSTGVEATPTKLDAYIFSGGDPGAQINACVTAAKGLNGAKCDAGGFVGTSLPNFTTPLVVGDSSGTPVELIVPHYAKWNFVITGGTSCLLNQYGWSSIVGDTFANQGFVLVNQSAANGAYCGYETLSTSRGTDYYVAQGFRVDNPAAGSGGTKFASGYNAIIQYGQDNSRFINLGFQDYISTDTADILIKPGVITERNCCSTTFDNLLGFGGDTGPTVLDVEGNSTVGSAQAITFNGGSFGHPGNGNYAILCHDTNSTTTNKTNLTFTGNLYMEMTGSGGSDTTTDAIKIDGCGMVSFDGITASSELASTTKNIVHVTTSYNASVSVNHVYAQKGASGSSWSYPVTAVKNDNLTSPNIVTDSDGKLTGYHSNTTYFDAINVGSCTGCGGGSGTGQVDAPFSAATRVENFGYSITAANTVANTVTATSLVGSAFSGRQNVTAGIMLPGATGLKTIKVHATGTVGTAASSFSLTLTVSLGGTTLSTITAPVVASLSSAGWELDYYFTVNSLTSANAGGCMTVTGASNAALIQCSSSASVTGLNFATDQKLDVTATWGTANAANTITVNQLTAYPVQIL